MSFAIKVISPYKLLCAGKACCLFYHRGSLWISDTPEQPARHLLKLPGRRCLSQLRLTERLLRLEPRFAVPYEDGFLLSWNGGMHYVDVSKATLRCLFCYRPGMHNPLGITKLQDIPGFADGYVFGDYFGNPRRESVGIYRIENGKAVCVYSFLPGQVLHIHGITADPKSGRVLICTGDSNEEAAIWEAFDDFQRVTPVMQGSQLYRSCGAYVTDGGILYATDTPLCDNGIYLHAGNTCQKLYDMPGPCIYSMRIARENGSELFVFATSVEPDSSLPSWRYRLTYRLGVGVKSRWVHIVAGSPEEGFRTVGRMKKDVLPMLLFQFGNAAFPLQKAEGQLYLTPTAVRKYDGKTLSIQPE